MLLTAGMRFQLLFAVCHHSMLSEIIVLTSLGALENDHCRLGHPIKIK